MLNNTYTPAEGTSSYGSATTAQLQQLAPRQSEFNAHLSTMTPRSSAKSWWFPTNMIGRLVDLSPSGTFDSPGTVTPSAPVEKKTGLTLTRVPAYKRGKSEDAIENSGSGLCSVACELSSKAARFVGVYRSTKLILSSTSVAMNFKAEANGGKFERKKIYRRTLAAMLLHVIASFSLVLHFVRQACPGNALETQRAWKGLAMKLKRKRSLSKWCCTSCQLTKAWAQVIAARHAVSSDSPFFLGSFFLGRIQRSGGGLLPHALTCLRTSTTGQVWKPNSEHGAHSIPFRQKSPASAVVLQGDCC